jgi:hypothetical protein
VLGRGFGDHRSRLVLIAVFAVAVLVTLAAAVVVTQRGELASANEPLAKEPLAKEPLAKEPLAKEPLGKVGLDPARSTCPTSEPDKLPPNALAGATNAALAHFEGIEDAEGQYAVSAKRGLDGEFFRHNCSELSPERAKLLQRRTVVVILQWPKMFPSASLSRHTVFVANFEGEYRVWWMFH